MEGEALLYILPVAALVLPALSAGRLTARTGRMRPAWVMAAAFIAAALAVFGWATRTGQDTTGGLPGVLLSCFVLAPAGFSALVGGAIGRMIAGRSAG